MAYRKRDDLLSDALTPQQVERLLQMRKEGFKLREIAHEFKVHRNTVSNIINRDKARRNQIKGNY